ncbi:glycosyl hydrolase family 8 [Mucilaginibacter sp. NFR10]|uniref:glycosyl hydrolase family 8 n=1 Tax=Mucilaginibacter sp. NFR10 TaxID=1566292 RepID=UPI000871B187|nr:glycosyl hydrolase family 8 [Mucilaginibacter sp. NFR10]SCW73788.1 Glycosyl hydrolases family 8 [Mucilaginibacter sp. NFR10]
MMLKRLLLTPNCVRYSLLLFIIFIVNGLHAQVVLRPFPQHCKYTSGTIKPNHLNQQQLDRQVTSFYDQWKHRYIKPGCDKEQFYVWFEKPGKECVSEGQGYGMVITALMAGYDKQAKTVYDGLYNYYKAHPAKASPYLMAWAQLKNCKNHDRDAATDGDIDIAYSLLLADKQWGSKGHINYLQEARIAMAAIMHYEINPKTFSVLLSDGSDGDSEDYYDMRASDFMPANFKAFESASKTGKWQKVIDNNYLLFSYLQKNYSPDAGLVPDFIRGIKAKARPAQPNYMESKYDGYYNYNACRVPWRITTDYLLYGDKRAKAFVNPINRWIKETTNGDPDNISAGYTLEGNDIKGRYFEALSFIAPFTVSAMVDKSNQQWLNKVWDYLVAFKLKDYDYYDNTIKMLDMIIVSGNYWKVE